MAFRRRNFLRPVNTVKHVFDTSTLVSAITNTVLGTVINTVDNAVLANAADINTGSKVSSIFFVIYVYSEGGELASEIPLVDFYFLKNPGNAWGAFNATNLPTPGGTGSHINKRHILHEEKGLAGGGNVSLTGVPMVFKGVVRIPRGRQRFGIADTFIVAIRTNFISKVCMKAIYKEVK